jgi:prepilin-type processing-associated H-X9-DG protein
MLITVPINHTRIAAMKPNSGHRPGSRYCHAFTLIELLAILAVIAILAAMLLPLLLKTKAQARSASCKNNLRQIGTSIQMYVSDHRIYPGNGSGPPYRPWPEQLAAYNPLSWTNYAWNCPEYLAAGGVVEWQPPPAEGGRFKLSTSYAYNGLGMSANGPPLGLGRLSLDVTENRVLSPSGMYAVGDNRPARTWRGEAFPGPEEMQAWRLPIVAINGGTEANAPHSDGYNLVFADGHVSLVKRRNYLYAPRSSQNWNRDHQPHPELWPPRSEWVIQN